MKTKRLINFLLGLIVLVFLFHIAVLLKLIPYDIAWGGRLQNDKEMYLFEAVSILINALLISVLLMKAEYINYWMKPRTVNIVLRVFMILFILNTIGNLFAKSSIEKAFSILTLVFAVLLGLILKTSKKPNVLK